MIKGNEGHPVIKETKESKATRVSKVIWARREKEGTQDLKANRATRDHRDQKEVMGLGAKQDL